MPRFVCAKPNICIANLQKHASLPVGSPNAFMHLIFGFFAHSFRNCKMIAKNYLSGLRSIYIRSCMSKRKEAGLSTSTVVERIRYLRYSMKRRKKLMKCCAVLILPGTASCRIESGNTEITTPHRYSIKTELFASLVKSECKRTQLQI